MYELSGMCERLVLYRY